MTYREEQLKAEPQNCRYHRYARHALLVAEGFECSHFGFKQWYHFENERIEGDSRLVTSTIGYALCNTAAVILAAHWRCCVLRYLHVLQLTLA